MESQTPPKSNLVLILDFGSQYTHLITRRIRKLSIFSLTISGTSPLTSITSLNPKVIILSGGPHSVHTSNAPSFPHGFIEYVESNKIYVLGICYGLQLIVQKLGGEVRVGEKQEYGRMDIAIERSCGLFGSKKVGDMQSVWMSHCDEVAGGVSRYFVTHSPEGMETLQHFLFNVCGVTADWNMEDVLEQEIKAIKEVVGTEDHVICALSGGVDSTVAATLVHKAIGDRLHCIFVDNGLLRFKEQERVMVTFERDLYLPVRVLMQLNNFLAKRKIIGKEFISIFDTFAKELEKKAGIKPVFLVQGTLYPDVIESCPPPGSWRSHSHTIKIHHNVGRLPKDMKLKLIEPLKLLFKDEVRELGKILNVPEGFLKRHPFPGPGLAVRVLGDVTQGNALEVLRQVDEIFIQSIKDAGLYDEIWQAFAVFLPIRSVGVQGDQRTHSHVVALRAVTSQDGMTADWIGVTAQDWRHLSRNMASRVKKHGVTGVTPNVTPRPVTGRFLPYFRSKISIFRLFFDA
ncbi:GMP synthase (glutamine-hydrolyzing) [Ranunculus cassubicifolius]